MRVRIIGERDNLAPDIAPLLVEAEELTQEQWRADADGRLQLWRSPGDRRGGAPVWPIEGAQGRIDPNAIGVEEFAERLDTAGLPDPDLIIRTSGEMRLSNFLLWQAAYAELVFLPILWPDFDDAAFVSALDQYAARERRFGAVAEPAVAMSAS